MNQVYLEQLWCLFLEFFHLPFILAGVERGGRSRAGAFTVGSGTHRLHRVKIFHAHTSCPQASACVPGQRPHDALTAAVGSLWCHADLFLPKDLKRKWIQSEGNYIVCCDPMTSFLSLRKTMFTLALFRDLQHQNVFIWIKVNLKPAWDLSLVISALNPSCLPDIRYESLRSKGHQWLSHMSHNDLWPFLAPRVHHYSITKM